MNLRGRIEKLENHHALYNDTVTLGDVVRASYWKEGDPRDLDLEDRISRSRLARMLAETLDPERRSGASAGGPAGETNQNVSRENGGDNV